MTDEQRPEKAAGPPEPAVPDAAVPEPTVPDASMPEPAVPGAAVPEPEPAVPEPETAVPSPAPDSPESAPASREPNPDPVGLEEPEPEEADHEPQPEPESAIAAPPDEARRKQVSGAGVLIGVLLALLGFTFVVQIRSNAGDAAYASAREGDLLQIMSDLDSYERRLNQDITSLEQTRRELQSGAAGRDAALAEAKARADALGILAGTLKARGPGVILRFVDETGRIKAGTLLNAIQELRGAGAEAMQIDGNGGSVRIIASTSFVDDSGGVRVDGRRLSGPYTIRAIGDPATLKPAMEIAGGVVAAARNDGGNVIVNQLDLVEINETRSVPELEHAKPVT